MWQVYLLEVYRRRFKYIAPQTVTYDVPINIPSYATLVNIQPSSEKLLLLGAGLSCIGSYDCKNLKVYISEGPYSGEKMLFVLSLQQLYDSGLVGMDGMPMITRWDDTNKVYVVSWQPREPWPVRGIKIDYIMPPPSLDTVSTATLRFTYILIEVM